MYDVTRMHFDWALGSCFVARGSRSRLLMLRVIKVGLDSLEILDSFKKYVSTVKKFSTVLKGQVSIFQIVFIEILNQDSFKK
jgi:hypothetical protein